MIEKSKLRKRGKFDPIRLATVGVTAAIALVGCGTSQSEGGQYEATAKTNMTWIVEYENDPLGGKQPRTEKFESVSLVNRNGMKPEGAVYQDDKGIWWPKNPPKPNIDEIEARRKRSSEKFSRPRILREVEYRVKFDRDGERLNLPTNYSVYRQVAKSYPDIPINFTMGVNNGSVTKATPVAN